jgi:predicted RNA-binding protein associated with RNAse of E/G family
MNVKLPTLYRKRFIPNELVKLDDDKIIHIDDKLIKTQWKVLKPRDDFSHGLSWYFLEKGFKISKFFKETGELKFVYCDIIEHSYNEVENSYVFADLLADVVIHNDGAVHVLDLGEIPEALDAGLISVEQAKDALLKLDDLLLTIYEGKVLELIESA